MNQKEAREIVNAAINESETVSKDEARRRVGDHMVALFTAYPKLLAVGIEGETPYFNDGDPCTHSQNTAATDSKLGFPLSEEGVIHWGTPVDIFDDRENIEKALEDDLPAAAAIVKANRTEWRWPEPWKYGEEPEHIKAAEKFCNSRTVQDDIRAAFGGYSRTNYKVLVVRVGDRIDITNFEHEPSY